MVQTNNTVLGRGKVHFDRFTDGYGTGEGFRYIGNTPSFGLNIETQDLDHYNADEGIKIKDESVTLEVNYSGSIVCDNIQADNLALFFFGEHNTITQASESAKTFTRTMKPGLSYQLGATPANPGGDRDVTVTSVQGAGALTEGTDYEVDAANGRLRIVEGGAVAGATEVTVTYDIGAVSVSRVISGDKPVQGSIWFESLNPVGTKRNFLMPKVVIRPNGEYQLKGDEWQQMSFNLEVLVPASGMAAIYADGAPYVAG